MANSNSANSSLSGETLRDQWLQRLKELLVTVGAWAKELGWATREIEKRMEDAEVGPYTAPALVLQRDTVRVMVEPIARSAPGAEGVVDMYLLPAYDDIASLYFMSGKWQIHYLFPHDPTPSIVTPRSGAPKSLSKQTLANVLEEMTKNAV
jgi:hypothetical protein